MFKTEGLFSSIPCPYQEACPLLRCIFQHPEAEGEGAIPLEAASQNGEDTLTPSHDQEGQRKRRRLDAEDASTKSGASYDPAAVPYDPTTQPAPSLPRTAKPAKTTLAATREISPPPLRRKTQTETPKPVKQPTGPTSNATTNVSTPKSSIKTPAKKTLKVEELLPRTLATGAPAAWKIRYQLVKLLHAQFKRLNDELAKDASDAEEELVLFDQALITKVLDIEEQATFSTGIYSNLVKNEILKYKRMGVKDWVKERTSEVAKKKTRDAAALSDTPISKPSAPPKVIETGLTVVEEIKLLKRLQTPISGLSKHGYVTTKPSDEDVNLFMKGIEIAKGWEVCDRCKSRFQVFPERREEDGALTSGGKCTYHYGKLYLQDKSATEPKAKRERRYKCCGEISGESTGCTQGDCHVFKISEVKRMASVLSFEHTPENPRNDKARPVCIDGEMGYTVYGLELIRLTATSWPDNACLFDVLVKPMGPILDLNSRFSGVWPKDFASAPAWSASSTPPKGEISMVESPAAARALLFSHLSPQTPLLGHGLENDLNATRIIHPTIIDTALLFPHSAGLPYRNGLKALMARHLNRHIQVVVDGEMRGHDSMEDANAAGELVRFKLSERWDGMKREGWVVNGGEFVAPGLKVEDIEMRKRSSGEVGGG